MRAYSLLASLVCLSLFGCASLPSSIDEISTKTNLASDRIVLLAKAHQVGRNSATQHYWVIEKNGPSQGTTFFGEMGYDAGATTAFSLPAGIHEELLAKLEETRFFQMKSSEPVVRPLGKSPDPAAAWIEIHYRGRKHFVTQENYAEIDDGFNKLWLFIGHAQQRSTVLSTKAISERNEPNLVGGCFVSNPSARAERKTP